jgi:hypothetical protein
MRWLVYAALLLPLATIADERILEFSSDVVVHEDASIVVTETIRVRAEGNRIRRGIYRDLPTNYRDKLRNEYELSIEPLAVLRNDSREPFHVKDTGRGIRVYFGSADRHIPAGVHTYTFRYRAARMLGFFENHDELYWNVTGFDWAFPIDTAAASVGFAFDVASSDITHTAYTGPLGARGRDFTSRVDAGSKVRFESSLSLSAAHGLTIVVGWPKGLVTEPTGTQRLGWLLRDNRNLLVAVAGLVSLLCYYIPVWMHYGKDPDEGVILTRYEPPDGFSPASLRYVRQMYYDDKVMTAAVVNLAVKGYLTISQYGDDHKLTRVAPGLGAPPLAAGEKELYAALFSGGDTVNLDSKYDKRMGEAREAHKQSLAGDYKRHYFQTNGFMNIPAIGLVMITTFIALNIGAGPTPFVIATVIAMFLVMAFFAIIMKRPTLRGRELLDGMKGFEDYLDVAEKEEMNLRNPPDKTPELFEKYLPFALALGVDQHWADKFVKVLARAGSEEGRQYRPGWYNGHWNTNNLSQTTSQLSSGLNSALASSVSPPGSSSGGGGGGSSGGGGGGGGGGGW